MKMFSLHIIRVWNTEKERERRNEITNYHLFVISVLFTYFSWSIDILTMNLVILSSYQIDINSQCSFNHFSFFVSDIMMFIYNFFFFLVSWEKKKFISKLIWFRTLISNCLTFERHLLNDNILVTRRKYEQLQLF